MTDQPTPDFHEPPVIETVLGVEFLPLQGWGLPHFGLYWNEIRDGYPSVDEQPALPPTIERFGADAIGPQSLSIPIFGGAASSVRCWFIDNTARRLIQLQNGRFIVNWRKVEDADEYPHYPELRARFETEWNRFRGFLVKHQLDEPKVVQCEVTYVNNINSGQGWETFADLPGVIAPWSGHHSGNFLPAEESVALNVRYLMPDNRGRLHVVLNRAIRKTDAQETIQINLTARGAPKTSHTDDVLSWLDLGRDWVVRGFTDFTSERMHKEIWRRTR
jgi:uncharacterized protein (TIGR04255 family)